MIAGPPVGEPARHQIRDELDLLFDQADAWPSQFKLAALGGYILSHPELIGRDETPRMKASREHRQERKL